MYVNGFVLAVPEGNRAAYIEIAEKFWSLVREYGALSQVECWEADVKDGHTTDFRRAVKCEEGEKIVFSWVTWPDRASAEDAALLAAHLRVGSLQPEEWSQYTYRCTMLLRVIEGFIFSIGHPIHVPWIGLPPITVVEVVSLLSIEVERRAWFSSLPQARDLAPASRQRPVYARRFHPLDPGDQHGSPSE